MGLLLVTGGGALLALSFALGGEGMGRVDKERVTEQGFERIKFFFLIPSIYLIQVQVKGEEEDTRGVLGLYLQSTVGRYLDSGNPQPTNQPTNKMSSRKHKRIE